MLYISPFEVLFILLLSTIILLLPLFAIVFIIKGNNHLSDKLIWTVVVLLFPLFGPLLYFTMGRNKRIA